MTTNQSNWESRLRKIVINSTIYVNELLEIEDFIRTLLKEERENIKKDLEQRMYYNSIIDKQILYADDFDNYFKN